MAETEQITVLLQEFSDGGSDALNRLMPLVYVELQRLANSLLHRESNARTLQPTALVHEAYARLVGQENPSFASRSHFLSIAQTEFYEQLTHLQIAALRPAWAPKDPCNATNSPRIPAIGLLTRGEYSRATTELETLLRTDNQPATRQLLGLAYEGSGQLEAAAEQFRLAALSRPNAAAMVAHGAALLFLGEVDQAEAVFHRALQQSGGRTALAKLGFGAAQFQHGRLRKLSACSWMWQLQIPLMVRRSVSLLQLYAPLTQPS
jgi:tetratricopeptide (TPR) repeat protein